MRIHFPGVSSLEGRLIVVVVVKVVDLMKTRLTVAVWGNTVTTTLAVGCEQAGREQTELPVCMTD